MISNIVFKLLPILILMNINLYSCSCNTPIITKSMIDADVEIDAKKSVTSFRIVWKFNKKFISSLSHYDTNKNSKFDIDEQKKIKDDFMEYIKQNHYLTDVIYIKKGMKIKKSEIRDIKIIDSGMNFSDKNIECYFNFDMNFILEKDHRLYIRFFDDKSNINVSLKNINLNNYSGLNIIDMRHFRANIYFYNYVIKHHHENCEIKEHTH